MIRFRPKTLDSVLSSEFANRPFKGHANWRTEKWTVKRQAVLDDEDCTDGL